MTDYILISSGVKMARCYSDEWEGIKYSAKTLGKLRVWGKSTYPYFVGDLVRVEVTLERIDNNARKFEDVFITEISPRDSEVRKDLSEKDFSSFNRLGDKKVIFVIEKRARASGEMQFYLGRGRIDEHKISKVLFSADIENDDQYILKFVFPFVSAIVGFFIAIVLPIVWKYVLIAWEWFWQYIKNA